MKIMINIRNIILFLFLCFWFLLFLNINGINYYNNLKTNHWYHIEVKENNHSSYTRESTTIESTSISSELKAKKILLDLSQASRRVSFARTYRGRPCYNYTTNSDISSYIKKGDYRSLYRHAMDYAINKISQIEKREFIVTCSFPGFDGKESIDIWNLAERRMRIRHTCKKYARVLGGKIYHEHLQWDKEMNFGYCGQFKAGTTTWMSRMLDWHGLNSSLLDTQEIHEEINKLYPPLTEEAFQKIRNEDPLIFSFVRHPFSRLVSTYLNRIKRHYRTPSSKIWIAGIRGKSLVTIVEEIKDRIIDNIYNVNEDALDKVLLLDSIRENKENYVIPKTNSTDKDMLDFREFALVAVKQILGCFNDVECLLDIDEHWQPQYVRCSPCQIEVEVPGQLETFQTDSDFLLKILNIKDPSIEKRKLNVDLNGREEPALRVALDHLDILSDDEIKLVLLAYTFDFNFFGYLFQTYYN